MATPYNIVLVTAPVGAHAQNISMRLIKLRLAACVNIVPRVVSSYWWKGKIEISGEALLIVKTKRSLVKKIIEAVHAIHPYSVPEVISIPILDGFPPYLAWVRDETKK